MLWGETYSGRPWGPACPQVVGFSETAVRTQAHPGGRGLCPLRSCHGGPRRADCAAMNLNVSSLPVCLSDSGSPGWAWFVLAAPMWWEPVVRAGADRRPRGAQPCPALRLLRRSVRQSYDFSTAVTNWAGAVTQSW